MINAILKKGGEDVTLEDEVTLSQRNAADRTKNEVVHIRSSFRFFCPYYKKSETSAEVSLCSSVYIFEL